MSSLNTKRQASNLSKNFRLSEFAAPKNCSLSKPTIASRLQVGWGRVGVGGHMTRGAAQGLVVCENSFLDKVVLGLKKFKKHCCRSIVLLAAWATLSFTVTVLLQHTGCGKHMDFRAAVTLCVKPISQLVIADSPTIMLSNMVLLLSCVLGQHGQLHIKLLDTPPPSM